MLRIGICDDQYEEREKFLIMLEKYCKKHNLKFQADEYSSGEQYLEKYLKGRHQILFLDIDMPGRNGIEIAKELRKLHDDSLLIVFLTYFPDYMADGFDVRASQYLIKPISYDFFEKKFDIILQHINNSSEQWIMLECQNDLYRMRLEELYSIEVQKGHRNYIRIIMNGKEIESKGNIYELCKKYSDFMIYVNRFTLVNRYNIFKVTNDTVVLSNGSEYQMGRKYKEGVKLALVESVVERVSF